jgi:hypothetical protein
MLRPPEADLAAAVQMAGAWCVMAMRELDARYNPGTENTNMQYMLMDYVNEAGWPELTRTEQEHWLGAYRAYMEAMSHADVLKSSHGLRPTTTATMVRTTNGKTQVLDGPYADSKEQLGGFHIIDVPDLDAAISWAARSPTALHGVVEVRPLWEGTLLTRDLADYLKPA